MCPKDYYIAQITEKVKPRGSEDEEAAVGFAFVCRPMWSKGRYSQYKVVMVDGSK